MFKKKGKEKPASSAENIALTPKRMLSIIKSTAFEVATLHDQIAFEYIRSKGDRALKAAIFDKLGLKQEDWRLLDSAIGNWSELPGEEAFRKFVDKHGKKKAKRILLDLKKEAESLLPVSRRVIDSYIMEIGTKIVGPEGLDYARKEYAVGNMFLSPLTNLTTVLEMKIDELEEPEKK